MDAKSVERALAAFCADAQMIFAAALARARADTGSKSAAEANRKFDGFEGSFASLKDFHAGAEVSLQLGYPNPDTMKGIRLEQTAHESVTRIFVTPNYYLATCLLLVYWWAVDPWAPPSVALDLLLRLRADRGAGDDSQDFEGAAETLGGMKGGLSLVRGAVGDVDMDPEAREVMFRL